MNEPESFSSYQANLRRGEMLRDQNRHVEAEKYLQLAIAEQPENAEGYYELAFCYCNWTDHSKKALETIDRAISLDPNQSEFFALRAWILGNLNKHKDSLQVADHALGMNPYNIMALNAQTRAYSSLSDWRQAETSARRTLAIDPRNEQAVTFLSQALRFQGRLAESEAASAGLLAHVPDSAMAQCSAGWSALQAGDYRRANLFFMEALRLDPNYDYARRGLLHSFNSRVWIYRVYFQVIAWLGSHGRGMRIFFLVLIYVVYQFLLASLRAEYGSYNAQPWIFVAVIFYLVLFGFGRSFGNFFLLFDRFARHALTTKEKAWTLVPVALYTYVMYYEIDREAWIQTAILTGVLLFFLWGVLWPRFQDAFARISAKDRN